MSDQLKEIVNAFSNLELLSISEKELESLLLNSHERFIKRWDRQIEKIIYLEKDELKRCLKDKPETEKLIQYFQKIV